MNSKEKERLERLNAYLISKGRTPKTAGGINYVKRNIGSVAKRKTGNSDTRTPKSAKKENMVDPKSGPAEGGLPRSRPTLKDCNRLQSSVENDGRTPKNVTKSFTPQKKNVSQKAHTHSMPNSTSKIPMKRQHTPSSKTNTSMRKKVLKCRTDIPANRTKSCLVKHEQQDERLNLSLGTKDKKLRVVEKLKGFKPGKVIATPVGSPVLTRQPTPARGTIWRTLRDEDDSDELTVLINSMMDDVQNCINENCKPDELRLNLIEFVTKMPEVKSHAKYWVTLAKVEQAAGESHEKICDIFNEAINANAHPIEMVQDAINSLALSAISETRPHEELSEMSPIFKPVATNQKTPRNLMISKFMARESPVLKSAATSPIIFDSPSPQVSSEIAISGSPSSVVKLRMVPRSSPIFEKLRIQKALPDDASAIITPVRRSKRIASAQNSYPASLQDHEPCLSTVQEIFPVLQKDSNVSNDGSKVSCGIVFNPNLALGEDCPSIAKVLKF